MENFVIQPDEAVLYEGTVKCKTYQGNLYQGNLLVTLTSQKLIFEKEKGIFKKERDGLISFHWKTLKFIMMLRRLKQKDSR